ncbi:hypothetical protein [Microbacterium aurum]
MARNDEVAILTATNSALQALYALWNDLGIKGRDQVAWAGDDPERRNLVGLVYVRGEADHLGRHVAMMVGYGEAPYGCGPYGGGWLWRRCETQREAYRESQALYDEHVLWEPIVASLERAEAWFDTNTSTAV